MRLSILLSLAMSASCATGVELQAGASRQSWPSLAKRPVESATPGVIPGRTPDITQSVLPAADITARLATAGRDISQLEQRWAAQRIATQQALAALPGRPGGEAEAAAQLETGRLDKLAGQVTDERTQIEAIVGELAMAAATGDDVSVPLRTAGVLLIRCAKLTAGGPAGSAGAVTGVPKS